MKPYDAAANFRLPKSKLLSTSHRAPPPPRDLALDDLHRALYGSLHPAGAIEEADEPSEESEGEGFLEKYAVAMSAAAVLGAAAVWWWNKRQKPPEPLRTPADATPPAPAPAQTVAPPAAGSSPEPQPSPPTPLRAVS